MTAADQVVAAVPGPVVFLALALGGSVVVAADQGALHRRSTAPSTREASGDHVF